MKIFQWKNIESRRAEEGAKGLTVRWLLDRDQGAENFHMRLFEMEPGGYSPLHSHPWEHEIFVLEGNGVVTGGGKEMRFSEGNVIFLPPGEEHQLRNSGKDTVRFLCLIPAVQ